MSAALLATAQCVQGCEPHRAGAGALACCVFLAILAAVFVGVPLAVHFAPRVRDRLAVAREVHYYRAAERRARLADWAEHCAQCGHRYCLRRRCRRQRAAVLSRFLHGEPLTAAEIERH